MKTAENMYHCTSSMAFELMLRAKRETALPALMITTIRISQIVARPMRSFMPSIMPDIFKRPCMDVFSCASWSALVIFLAGRS